jgi:general secretion pathway protein D
VGGTNVNVQYVDVGVKLNAEPVVQLDNDISIKVSLEVSVAGTPRNVGDGNQVVDIKNRNLDTVLSLKDGETSIIGGLLQRIDSDSRTKPSIVGDIPIIGRLLTHKDTSNEKTELVLAITPHLVRGITVPDAEVSSFWSGKEDEPSATNPYGSFIEEPDIPAPQPSQSEGAMSQPQPSPQGGSFPNVQAGALPQAEPIPSVSEGTTPPAPQTGAKKSATAAGPRTRIILNLGAPSSVLKGQRFSVTVTASNATGLYNAPFVLSYDPLLLDYEGASEGDFLKKDGGQTLFQASGVKSSGQVQVGLGRTSDAAGVNGSGSLAAFTFTAKGEGSAKFGFLSSAFTDAGGSPIDVTQSRAVVEVKQP